MGLKILWLTSDFPTSTDSNRNLFLWHPLEALKKIGIESIILNAQAWKPFSMETVAVKEFSIEIKNYRYFSIPRHHLRVFSNFSYLRTIVPSVIKLHQLHQFDVIHAHGEICGLAAVAAARQLHIPAVVTIHGVDMCPRIWNGFSGKMFQRMLNKADKILYVGESLQKYFDRIVIDNQRSCVTHNGFRMPMNIPVEKPFKKSQPIRIISVSNLHEGKGIDLTLYALAALKNKGVTNWFYTIVGSGDQKKYLENLIVQFNLINQVKFKDACSHGEVYAYLKESDIFCLPSYREAFGIAYVEAMAHGLLTIAVKGQGPQAFIEHGKTGLLVKPQNIDDLTHTLHMAITQFQYMLKITNAAKKYVLNNLTWEKHAKKLFTIYKEICI